MVEISDLVPIHSAVPKVFESFLLSPPQSVTEH